MLRPPPPSRRFAPRGRRVGVCLKQADGARKAIFQYTAAMTGRPTNNLAASILQAANLVQQGQWRQAEVVLAQVLAANPSEPDGLQLLALIRENQGKLADAESLLRQSLALRPQQPHVQVHLGRILAQTGRHQNAIDLLQAAAQAQDRKSTRLN